MFKYNQKRSEEPIWWALFSAGGTWFAIITPATIIFLAIMVPLGMVDSSLLSYERVTNFASTFIGACFIIGTLALPMWHAMHRIYHAMHDLQIHVGMTGKVIFYFIAALVSALSIIFVLML